MPERVVVRLEPVQVEQKQQSRLVGCLVEELLEAPDERTAVPERGQGIGQRLGAGAPQQREVLLEREHEPPDHGQKAERCGDERHGLDAMEVVPHLDREADERHADGREDERHAVQAGAHPEHRHDRPGRDQHEAGQPRSSHPP